MLTKNEQNLLILIFLIVVYFTWKMNNLEKKNIENFTTTTQPVFAGDVEAIEKLSNFAIKLSEGNGNITVPGNVTFNGALTTDRLIATGVINTTGTITGATITSTGVITANGTITGATINSTGAINATGTVTGATINSTGAINATGTVTGATINSTGAINATGTVTGATITSTGGINAISNITGNSEINAYGNITALGRSDLSGNWISGGNLTGRWVKAYGDFTLGRIDSLDIDKMLNSWVFIPNSNSKLEFWPRMMNPTQTAGAYSWDNTLWDNKKNLITFDGLTGGIKSNEIDCNKISGASAIGAWIYTSSNNCNPIYSSIGNYIDYNYSTATGGIDTKYMVMPGYKLEVTPVTPFSGTSTIYDNIIGTKPKLWLLSTDLANKGRSCKLFYKNNEILEIDKVNM
jgi:hypothetical protein